MKKTNWDMILMILAGIGAITSLVVLIICVNAMITTGATALRIWGLIGLSISFIICVSIIGVLITANRQQRMPMNNSEIR